MEELIIDELLEDDVVDEEEDNIDELVETADEWLELCSGSNTFVQLEKYAQNITPNNNRKIFFFI